MRDEFRAELREINHLLVSMAEAVRAAMSRASDALLRVDRGEAQAVLDHDAEVNAWYRFVEDKVYDVLARQAPVASDLRLVITSLHMATDLERMGDLAKHVAKVALRRYPAPAVPDDLKDVVRQMAEVADRMAAKIGVVLAEADAAGGAELEREDDAMDELNRAMFAAVLSPTWAHGVECAIDAALLGRWYERFADHAVNAGRHVVFLATGESLRA